MSHSHARGNLRHKSQWAKKVLLVLLGWLCCAVTAQGQLQTAIWYFGQQAGLDFRNGSPTALVDGQLRSSEGSSSLADSVGNLLLYTNGISIWNRQHQVMTNGTGLSGDTSSTQHLIVAQPGNAHTYYVFTPPEYQSSYGLQYSVVDLRRQGGLGEVIRKNVPLLVSSTERIAAVLHANRRDIWVLAHGRNSDQFYAYLLTATGLNPVPVTSRDGFLHTSVRAIGQLKASPDGRRLALTAGTFNTMSPSAGPGLELLDFDASTGRVTNPIVLPPARLTNYGVEFSPDGTKLYVTDPGAASLFQYDLLSVPVAASLIQIPTPTTSPLGQTGKNALQLGPDGRIYVAHARVAFLGIVTAPDQRGAACGYVDNGVSLNGRLCNLGLPSFLSQALWYFRVVGQCQDQPIAFSFPGLYRPDSVQWDFGNPSAGRPALSRLFAPTYTYARAGRYLVTLTLFFAGAPATVLRQYVQVSPLPTIDLGRDTALCPGNRLVLTATTTGGTSYRWQDNSTASTFLAQRAGWYWVDVTSAAGCTARDSLLITPALVPRVRLGNDTVVCVGQTLTLRPRPAAAGVRYRWQDGSTGPVLTIAQPGDYWVEGSNAAGCSQRDSIRVYYLTPPTIYLGRDTTLCRTAEAPFVLDATLPGVRYRWSDGSSNATFVPPGSGTYWVTVSTTFCSATDTIRVRLYDCQQAVFVPNVITPNGDGKNDELRIIGLTRGAWSLSIYNRWGREVYQAHTYQQDWKALGLANGLYYYWLRETVTGRQVKGWVEVIR